MTVLASCARGRKSTTRGAVAPHLSDYAIASRTRDAVGLGIDAPAARVIDVERVEVFLRRV